MYYPHSRYIKSLSKPRILIHLLSENDSDFYYLKYIERLYDNTDASWIIRICGPSMLNYGYYSINTKYYAEENLQNYTNLYEKAINVAEKYLSLI